MTTEASWNAALSLARGWGVRRKGAGSKSEQIPRRLVSFCPNTYPAHSLTHFPPPNQAEKCLGHIPPADFFLCTPPLFSLPILFPTSSHTSFRHTPHCTQFFISCHSPGSCQVVTPRRVSCPGELTGGYRLLFAFQRKHWGGESVASSTSLKQLRFRISHTIAVTEPNHTELPKMKTDVTHLHSVLFAKHNSQH